MNQSDNKKDQINVSEYLPEVYRSDINNVLADTVFNRHLSKDDTIKVSGYIGTGNPHAITKRQIKETSSNNHEQSHRQAFQLAPTMYTKVGTVEYALSYKHFLKQLELQGIDIGRLPKWASALEFNWVPPINIDMLVNYQDYYWKAKSVTDLPQYLTIENRCNKATDKVSAFENLMSQRGLHLSTNNINFDNNTFALEGKWIETFPPNSTFTTNISNNQNLIGKFWTVLTSQYDIGTNKTIIETKESIAPSVQPISPNVGDWWYDEPALKVWDSFGWVVDSGVPSAQIILPSLFPIISSSVVDNTITISGKQTDLFVPDFVILTTNSISPNFQNKFWTVASSTFNEDEYATTITIVEPFAAHQNTAPVPLFNGQWWFNTDTNLLSSWDGIDWIGTNAQIVANISLSEILIVFQSELNCKCGNSKGWDIGQWDDNSLGNIVWNAPLLANISHPTELDWMNANVDDVENDLPKPFSMWYDTSTNQLKQYGDNLHPLPSDLLYAPTWIPTISNFSAILNLTQGQTNWDETIGCDIQQLNQWSGNNEWQHKTAINAYTQVKRAQLPILEYDSKAELNEWTEITYVWKYRQTKNSTFELTSKTPNRFELEPIKGYQVVNISGDWYVYLFDKTSSMNVNIDLTSVFTPDFVFKIVDDTGFSEIYTVDSSEFRSMINESTPNVSGQYFATVVKLKELNFTAPITGGPNNVRIIPGATSIGDVWEGYHTHWVLCTNLTSTKPVDPQPVNLSNNLYPGTTVLIKNNPVYDTYLPQVREMVFGATYQSFTVDIQGVTDVDIVPDLLYNSAAPTYYALAESNSLRVYVNNIRQYGTYTETTTSQPPDYTVVGQVAESGMNIKYVTGIKFTTINIQIGDVIRIEVGPAALSDMGLYAVPVRTVEDDTEFNNNVMDNIQPVYMDLSKYAYNTQVKSSINQYPLFNVYDIITNNVVAASSLFSFKESSNSPINGHIQRRIIATDGNYEFEQHLLEFDNSILYGYRDTSRVEIGKYWYSPINKRVVKWDGKAWSDNVVVTTTLGLALRTILVSETDPVELHTVEQALWMNSFTKKLYKRVTGWVEIPNILIADTDPSIQTIWKCGKDLDKYIPQYVDVDRNVVGVGDLNGDWEIVKQWTYNPDHNNKKTVTFSQITTHFRSIVNNQPPTLGLIGGGIYSYNQSDYNYGVGGTIKEFNGAFDTLISSVNVNNITPIGVIEYASAEYASNIRVIRDIFNKSVLELLSSYSVDTLINFSSFVVNNVISRYEDNDFMASVYGDTTSFNHNTKQGVRNWITTAPMLGLSPLYMPHVITDGEFVQIFHHDGHRSNITYTNAEQESFARKVISLPDLRVNGGHLGQADVGPPPSTEQLFLSLFGGNVIRPGVFWYQINNNRIFYRFELYTVSATHPTMFVNNVEIPDDTQYYNTTSHNVYKKVGLSWVGVNAINSYDIAPLWKEIDFRELLSALYLEIETRLYDVSRNTVSVFDYDALTSTPDDLLVYNQKRKKRFEEYVINFSVSTPYVNTQYRPTDAFTWNYSTSLITTPPHNNVGVTSAASWQQLYTNWYGTPYPHLEPWKLQGYHDKPIWWDAEYLNTTGTRKWIYNHSTTTGMWENIRIGVVPIGYPLPTGIISTGATNQVIAYNYISVNISDNVIAGGYASDQLLPPYYTNNVGMRSIFDVLTQIIAPDADYYFGDGNPIEWQWTTSSIYPYENPIIAYMMEPVRFLRSSFGPEYTLVNNLEVDVKFKKVFSHSDTLFHGDIFNTNQLYSVIGLNQWYINYNRFAGFDTSTEFRELWVGWNPLLTYQFNGVVDTNTLNISNKHFDLITQDYNIALINNGVIKDLWVDAFNVKILTIPPAIIQYNNQNKWKLELNSLASISRELSYYDVKAYPFIANTVTNVCQMFRYNIVNIDVNTKRFYVTENQTDVFTIGTQLTVAGTTFNDGNYSVLSSVYEPANNITRINVSQPIVSALVEGDINIGSFVLPWSTGDMVVFSSTKLLPAPLVPNTPYYIISNSAQSFYLAETFNDSINNIQINFTTAGLGIHTIAEVQSSFNIMGGNSHSRETWYHYALDKSSIKTFTPPYVITGMQSLINIIDGYTEYQKDAGILQGNSDSSDFDPNTGRLISWSVEVERFIDWAYGLRRARLNINDRHEFTVNTSDNTISFIDDIPAWINGTAIQVSTSGTLPIPLNANDTYYVYKTEVPGVIKISTTQDVNYLPFHIDLLTQGSGRLYINIKDKNRNYPQFELNPTRNNIWIDTPKGVLSNIISGPYADIRIRQTLFDQYGRPLDSSKLLTYRQDMRSHVAILPQLQNDFDKFYVSDPYNYLHLGGGHFFLEGFEHFILFNSYSSSGALLYDPFLGLSTPKFEVNFSRKTEQTLRPTLGGYYLKGQEFVRNIEGAASDLRDFYDTYAGSEDSQVVKLSRSLLGYNGTSDYLDVLNVDSKSQFLFYRGMINAKGSVSSVAAYINSKRFIDANIDEFWAIKIAEFGDNRTQVYPEVLLRADDGIIDDIRFEFVGIEDDITNEDIQTAVNKKRFKLVSFSDDSRWNNFPEQRAKIKQPLFLDAELNSVTRLFFSNVPPVKSRAIDIDYWFNTTNNTLRTWNGVDWGTVVYDKIHISPSYTNTDGIIIPSHLYWKHDAPCDDVRVVRRDVLESKLTFGVIESSNITDSFTVIGNITEMLGGVVIITVTGSNNNADYTIQNVLYDTNTDITTIFVNEAVPFNGIGGVITVYAQSHIISAYASNDASDKANSFVVKGDMTDRLYSSSNILVSNSSNAGLYTIQQSLYDNTQNITHLYVLESITETNINNGIFTYDYLNFDSYSSVHFKPGDKGPNTYYKVNAEVVRMDRVELFDVVHIYRVLPAVNKINPARLVQRENNSVVENVVLWHPAYGIHYNQAINNIDIIKHVDPAIYSTDSGPSWNSAEVGTIWFDTSLANYVPYYDDVIYPDINDRLKNWGKLSGFGDIKVYQWVRSTVHPREWDKLAIKQQGNLTIPQNQRITGTSKKVVFRRERIVVDGEIYFGTNTYVKVSNQLFGDSDSVFIQAESLLPPVLRDNTVFNVTNLIQSTHQTFTLASIDNTSDSANVDISIIEQVDIENIGTETTPLLKFHTKTGLLSDGDHIKFSTIMGGVLPNCIPAINTTSQYKVSNATTNPESSFQTFDIVNVNTDTPIVLTGFGVGQLSIKVMMKVVKVVQTFDSQPWKTQKTAVQRIIGAWITEISAINPLLKWTNVNNIWTTGQTVDIYLNGTIIESGIISILNDNITLPTTSLTITSSDYIDIVRPIHTILGDDVNDTVDDGSTLVQWKEDYEFSTQSASIGETSFVNYYFWVEQSTVQSNTNMSLLGISQSLLNMPAPYMIVQKPLDSTGQIKGFGYDEKDYGVLWSMGEIPEFFITISIMYREAIIRNISNVVINNDGYMIQFTRDWTLRDGLDNTHEPVLKNKHTEWLMFREKQLNKIPLFLWNKLIESLSGVSLTDNTPIPSLDRVLYDDKYNAESRYGFELGQTFVDRQLGLATVLTYLQSSVRDFAPINIDDFFSQHKFNTSADIREAMVNIYETFSTEHVNGIWFDVLQDALSCKAQYNDLLKTSWIALHVTSVLDVDGLFDE